MGMTMTWNTFKTRQGETMHVAFGARHRYMIRASGHLLVTMKRADESIYEGKFRATANARLYAGELEEAGGPRR